MQKEKPGYLSEDMIGLAFGLRVRVGRVGGGSVRTQIAQTTHLVLPL